MAFRSRGKGAVPLIRPVISACPERVVGSACASTFSRLARHSLALRPAHSCCHQVVARFTRRLQPFRYLHSCSGCFRLEHLPGGIRTHWKAAPFHGAHPTRSVIASGVNVCNVAAVDVQIGRLAVGCRPLCIVPNYVKLDL